MGSVGTCTRRLHVVEVHLYLPGHSEGDILVLFEEQQDSFFRVIDLKSVHLWERDRERGRERKREREVRGKWLNR